MPSKTEDWLRVISEVQAGDRAALVRLTRLITGFLRRYGAYQSQGCWNEVVQDVLVAVLQSERRRSVREVGAFVNYVGAITRNKLVDFVHRQQQPGVADRDGDPEGAALRSGTKALERALNERSPDVYLDLRRALVLLPERLREVVDLIYLQGCSYEEAAQRLGVPLGTLKRLQTQGLRELRVRMGYEA